MLIWFRNDLRIHDNPALHFYLSEVTTQNIHSSKASRKAIFFISEKQWRQHHWSPIKIDFIKRHAYSLVDDLAQLNIELELVEEPDFSEQIAYLNDYCIRHNISSVVANKRTTA